MCTPLVYLWDPGDGSPGEQPASENLKFSNFLKLYHSRHASPHYYSIIQLQVLHGILSQFHWSTNNTSNVLKPTFSNSRQISQSSVQRTNKLPRAWYTFPIQSNPSPEPKLDLRAVKGSIKRPQRSGASPNLAWVNPI
jgi:hypothetical protein